MGECKLYMAEYDEVTEATGYVVEGLKIKLADPLSFLCSCIFVVAFVYFG
tara:strand:+ start:32694 stop:32843 length:150 start_codon:yes stop_codon:yes gene_type:complete